MSQQRSTEFSRGAPAGTGFLPARLRTAIGIAAIAALVPYTVMKLMWLSGSRIGMVAGGVDHMHDTRLEVGNVITVGLMVLAAAIVVVLISRWGLRLPWWTIVVPAAGATGAVAPIALGLPIGVGIQAALVGNVSSGGEGNLAGAVFAVVYGGFGVFGMALAALLVDYVQRRWGAQLATGPLPPRSTWVRGLAVASIVPLAVAMVVWAFARDAAALPGWESVAQRVVLVAIAVLAVGGSLALLVPADGRAPRARWFAGWVGCCTAAVQGPVLILLANDAAVNPVLLAVAIIATPSATALVLTAMWRAQHGPAAGGIVRSGGATGSAASGGRHLPPAAAAR